MSEILPGDDKIHVLPTELANQIAAGEVVERPASVIKELVENALDAGATRIDVEVEQGGIALIRVVDNGTGMGPKDAEQSVHRHATSKIQAVDDLFAIRTLGFRGEALPSIAAVSRFRLTTRLADVPAAYTFGLTGGMRTTPGQEAGAPVGTTIEVRDLFYNVPARLKFLKGEATEFGHIQETLVRVALAFPQVHFRLRRASKTVWEVPPHGSLLARAQALLGPRGRSGAQGTLYAAQGTRDGIHVEACLGEPADATSTARNVYLLVNQRFVRDRALLHAVGHAYGSLLAEGRFPTAVVHVRVPGDQVDVNVHPQKLEVRFAHPQDVYTTVRQVLQKTISGAPWLLQSTETTASYDRAGTAPPGWWAAEPRPAYGAVPARPPTEQRPFETFRREPLAEQLPFAPSPDEQNAPREPGNRLQFQAMQYLGQVHKTYLLCEDQNELVVIDQHAAHERVAFERLRKAQGERSVQSQRLLLPLTFEMDAARTALVEEHQELLSQLGFGIRPFGGHSIAVVEVPDMAFFGRGARIHQEPLHLLEKVLDDLQTMGTTQATQTPVDRVLATVACHSVVRAGDVLDAAAARALLAAMDEIEYVPYCPHGRPVLIRIPKKEWDRRFGRLG